MYFAILPYMDFLKTAEKHVILWFHFFLHGTLELHHFWNFQKIMKSLSLDDDVKMACQLGRGSDKMSAWCQIGREDPKKGQKSVS